MRDRLRRREPENEIEKRSKSFDQILGFLHIFFAGFMTLLIIYLFFIQVVDVGKYRAKARSQRVGRIFSMRGDIYDRNGKYFNKAIGVTETLKLIGGKSRSSLYNALNLNKPYKGF